MKQAMRPQTLSMEHTMSGKHYNYISTRREFTQKLWDPLIYFVCKPLEGVPGVARDDQWRNQIEYFSYITKITE